MNINNIKTQKNNHTSCPVRSIVPGSLLLVLSLAGTPAMAVEADCNAATNINAAQLNCFKPNTLAKSAEVNANFEYLLQDNKNLQQNIGTLQQENHILEQRIAALEAKLAAVTYDAGNKKLLISGVNVKIVNGTNTQHLTNGTGNLIIGYNADATREVCSGGSGDTAATCTGTWGTNQRTGSHNVIIGDQHQYTQSSALIVGLDNAIVGYYTNISGGAMNTASGSYASISGGYKNTANGSDTSISGGTLNTASGDASSISGGTSNTASEIFSSISGGLANTASGEHASISGGVWSIANREYASVSGGGLNTASAKYASVSGGSVNTASGEHASVSGGSVNTASGESATVVGSRYQTAAQQYEIKP